MRPRFLQRPTRSRNAPQAASVRSRLFNFGNQSRTDNSSIRESARARKHGQASEIPNPTAIGSDVKLRARRRRAGKSSGSASFAPVTPVREIRYRNPDEHASDFLQSLIGGGRRGQENGVQAMRVHDSAIFFGFFRRQIGD